MPRQDRRATSADVARLAGVSRATVSYVLNDAPGQTIPEATRQRVREAADELGYLPNASARALQRGGSDMVLMAVPNLPQSVNLGRLQEYVGGQLSAIGKSLAVWVEGKVSLRETLRSINPCAVLAPVGLSDTNCELLRRAHMPFVDPSDEVLNAIRSISLGRMQVDYLLGTGRRRIGLTLPREEALATFRDLHRSGVRDALAAAGLTEVCVVELPTRPGEDVRPETAALESLVTAGANAVACYNDIHAAQVLRAARVGGVDVPGDLAVMGNDDVPLAPFLQPPLTTIAHATPAFAYALVARIAELTHTPLEGLERPGGAYAHLCVRESA